MSRGSKAKSAVVAGLMLVSVLPVTGFGTASFEGSEIDVPIELAEITPDAVFGADARGCSAETGAKLVEALTELGTRFVRHYAERTQ